MNTFFYAPRENDVCKKTAERLRRISQLNDLIALPCGSQLNTPEALMLRNGDLIFLFAENSQALDELIALRGDFEGFRIILILMDLNDEMIHKGHILKPRFITSIKDSWLELESIVDKIIMADCCQWLLSATGKTNMT